MDEGGIKIINVTDFLLKRRVVRLSQICGIWQFFIANFGDVW